MSQYATTSQEMSEARGRSRSRSRTRSRSSGRRPKAARAYKASLTSLRGLLNAPDVHVFVRNISMTINMNSSGFAIGASNFLYAALYMYGDTVTFQNGVATINSIVPGYTDFSALFDEVQVDEWVIQHTSCNSSQAGTIQPGSPIIGFTTDYNDRIAPTAVGDIQQHVDYRSRLLNSNRTPMSVSLRPRMQAYVLDAFGTAVPGNTKRGYYKSTLQIEHYGMKYAFVVPLAVGSLATLCLEMKIKFKCRGVK